MIHYNPFPENEHFLPGIRDWRYTTAGFREAFGIVDRSKESLSKTAMKEILAMPLSLLAPNVPGPEPSRANWIQFTPPWESAPETPRKAAAPSFHKTVTIVIADDDPVSRELVSTIVSKCGFPSIVTQDGYEAMAAIRAERGPVVAILDWMMPGMDGLQVCRRVRENGKSVHIILLTARAAKESLVEGLESGADDYLVKPFNKNELLARIHVGIRILDLQKALVHRVKELEEALAEINTLRNQLAIPL